MTLIENRRLRDQITDRLREEILLGEITEGEPLREAALATRFGVSRIPIRDAILQLTSEGLLIAEPNRGAKVSAVWDEAIRPTMLKVRRDIECMALRFLMRRVNELIVERFQKNLKAFEAACRESELPLVVRYDMEFHRLVLRESGHRGLEAVWLPLMGGMRLPYGRHQSLMESHAEHAKVVQAIMMNDRIMALAALKANIQ
jgi:DNA-binding GntR family transcriptional regulator